MDGLCEVKWEDGNLKDSSIKGEFKQGKRHGHCTCVRISKKENKNYIREGLFQDGLQVEGTLKGDDTNWKCMNFIFKEGFGKGTYKLDNDSKIYTSSIQEKWFEKDVRSGLFSY